MVDLPDPFHNPAWGTPVEVRPEDPAIPIHRGEKMKKIGSAAILAFVLIFSTAVGASEPPAGDAARAMATKIATHYGVTDFGQVEVLRFTFNAQIGDKTIRRSWTWRPDSGEVTYEGPDPSGQPVKLSYRRESGGAPGAEAPPAIDAWFINDQYWLLFPLHLAWDGGLGLNLLEGRPLPMKQGRGDCLVVTYPQGVGYTPGDVYELYADPRGRLVQWVYRKGGAALPTRIATWEDHRRVGPLLLSLLHKGENESFRLWFSDVALRLKGGAEWSLPLETEGG
jgi:hypothetical protein